MNGMQVLIMLCLSLACRQTNSESICYISDAAEVSPHFVTSEIFPMKPLMGSWRLETLMGNHFLFIMFWPIHFTPKELHHGAEVLVTRQGVQVPLWIGHGGEFQAFHYLTIFR